MTGKDLFREVGNINEKYITEAEETKKSIIHNVAFRRGLGTVACLILCVGIFAITRLSEKITDTTASNTTQNNVVASWDGASDTDSEKSDRNDFVNSLGEGKKEESAADSSPQYSVPENVISEKAEQEDMMSAEPEMSDIIYSYKTVVNRLQAYPDVYEELLETGAFVVVHGKVTSGQSAWEKFLADVQDEIPSEVDLVEFTEEGDAIITGIVYDGEIYHVVMDCTRDAWGETEIVEYEYKYLYTDTWNGCTDVILSDVELEDEEIREAIMTEGLDIHALVQYIEE